MLLVTISWVFFDIDSLKEALSYIGVMFGRSQNIIYDNLSMYLLNTNLVIIVIAISIDDLIKTDDITDVLFLYNATTFNEDKSILNIVD